MPKLTTLKMQGRLGGSTASEEKGRAGARLKEILEIASRFPQLQHLEIPASCALDLGFDAGSWCTAVAWAPGPGVNEHHRQMARENAVATEKAAEIVFSKLPRLTKLSVGQYLPEVSSTWFGLRRRIRWPWSDRLEDWSWEVAPEEERGCEL
jgi:hypothetical protein